MYRIQTAKTNMEISILVKNSKKVNPTKNYLLLRKIYSTNHLSLILALTIPSKKPNQEKFWESWSHSKIPPTSTFDSSPPFHRNKMRKSWQLSLKRYSFLSLNQEMRFIRSSMSVSSTRIVILFPSISNL